MQAEFINLSLAFVEGLALILSPCILPILPIILSGSIDGNRNRPYGIIIGFIFCFSLFTFFSRSLVSSFALDLNLLRIMSFGLLILFGITMMSNYLTRKFDCFTDNLANVGFKLSGIGKQTGFISGLWFGALVGLIWTPCAGPILAAVIVQSVLQTSTWNGFLTILCFATGVSVPMMMIILFGRAITKNISFLSTHTVFIRKSMGLIIIFAVLAMYFAPNLFIPTESDSKSNIDSKQGLVDGIENPYPAPDFKDIALWINSKPIQMEKLRGKVVLIDFWAYSCINCIRTLPYLKDWYKKYHDKGLEIVGVHSPEFDFERSADNVRKAVSINKIAYPVALDNNFSTWTNFKNHYWPAHYLIDTQGRVVYEHFGEGKYDVTEHNIRDLLGIETPLEPSKVVESKFTFQTPETYLGYGRIATLASTEEINKDQAANYTYPKNLIENFWALNGKWSIQKEKIVSAQKSAQIKLHYVAKSVYAVIGSSDSKPIKVKITNDGVEVKTITVTGHLLYNLISLGESASGLLELTVSEPGLELYTFTFGN